ncbi:DUF4352 domain-containing protein [Rhizocola hellebori]|nr:DUF4352 domain-containing protein [Rhizocola hellebori]
MARLKIRWTMLGIAGALVMICCGGGLVAYVTGDSGDTRAAEEANGRVSVATLGVPVRDGLFEFTVHSVRCGESKVGSDYLSKTAQGQFCLVNLQVKNIGKEARTFDFGNQQAFGEENTKYSSDGAASLYANDQSEAFLNEINPGNAITADVVFDIGKGAKLLAVELHDSAFSGGVKVRLG